MTDKTFEVAPFALIRVAALPYGRIAGMAPPKTLARIQQILTAEKTMDRLRPGLEEALFKIVPQIEEKALSRATLKLRRDIHNHRKQLIPAEKANRTAALLNDENRSALEAWLCAQREAGLGEIELEKLFKQELQNHVRPGLRWPLEDPLFSRGLAMASRDVHYAIERESKLPTSARAKTMERSLLGYFLRAAAKTSPFASFMHVALAELEGPETLLPDLQNMVPVSIITLNRAVIDRFFRLLVRHCGTHERFRYRINPTIRDLGKGRIQALVDHEVILLGRPWCQERVAVFRFHEKLVKMLQQDLGVVSFGRLQTALQDAGLEIDQSEKILLKLLERKLIRVLPFTDAFDPQPENSLLAFIEPLQGETPRLIRNTVTWMIKACKKLASAPRRERAELIQEFKTREAETRSALADTENAYQNVVLEESWLCGAPLKIGREMADHIGSRLAGFLGTQVGIKPEFIRMRRWFIEAYGEGGSCDDLLGFLMSVHHRLVDMPELGNAAVVEDTPPAQIGSKMGLTVQIQVAHPDLSDLSKGDPLIIVNKAYERAGWLAARFGYGPKMEMSRLTELMRQWLLRSYAPFEPIDLVLDGHNNGLQAHPAMTKRIFSWPGQSILPSREGVVYAHEVKVRHNPETGMLDLFDKDGKGIALAYLGNVLPMITWGISYALSILAHPLSIRRPPLDLFQPKGEHELEDVIVKERLTRGSLIMVRKSWSIRVKRLTEKWFARSGAGRLLDVARELDCSGLPPVFFAARKFSASTNVVADDALANSYKPLWIDTGNPFCLDLLERLAQDQEWLVFSEFLPDEAHMWLTDNGNKHVAELHWEMIVTASDPGSR